ncbi:hypothetical protein [Streptomyces sp. NPDC048669]|uniref:hypothetical protein n=1 Tax=Streptomyces sp. NPDC048669 TaxID=3155267 RepID=UPI00341872F5
MPGDLRFSWELSGSAWATCRVADSSWSLKRTVSYCTDALADLLRSVAGLYGPTHIQRASFDLEPSEMRWVIRGRGAEVPITIYEFPDVTSYDRPESEGRLAWTSTQPRALLSHAVVEAAQEVLRIHGEDGYRAKWVQHPFPVAALRDLRRLHMRDDSCGLPHWASTP